MPHDQVEDHLIHALGQDNDDTTDPALTAPPPPAPVSQLVEPLNTAKDPFSVLSRIPADIAAVRQQLFALEEPVEFSLTQWEKYWP